MAIAPHPSGIANIRTSLTCWWNGRPNDDATLEKSMSRRLWSAACESQVCAIRVSRFGLRKMGIQWWSTYATVATQHGLGQYCCIQASKWSNPTLIHPNTSKGSMTTTGVRSWLSLLRLARCHASSSSAHNGPWLASMLWRSATEITCCFMELTTIWVVGYEHCILARLVASRLTRGLRGTQLAWGPKASDLGDVSAGNAWSRQRASNWQNATYTTIGRRCRPLQAGAIFDTCGMVIWHWRPGHLHSSLDGHYGGE